MGKRPRKGEKPERRSQRRQEENFGELIVMETKGREHFKEGEENSISWCQKCG